MTDAGLIDRLHARWRTDLEALGLSPDSGEVAFAGIVSSYTEPHRAYHTLEHLDFLFARLDAHTSRGDAWPRLAFAGWYHDVIYDPQAGDNEARSADRAVAELGALGVAQPLRDRIAALILATASHAKGRADHDDDIFLDADFAILGADPERYRRYVAGVRFEYSVFDDAAWRKGRGAFLRCALAQARFFRTDIFEQAYGAQARANIAAELAALSAD